MCLVALFFRAIEDAPVVVGANREEIYTRPGEVPAVHEVSPGVRAVMGRDTLLGGTWLGVNQFGVLIAVTNRKKNPTPPAPRSRGLLARELLACSSAKDAVELASRELSTNPYAGCNFLCVDAERAVVVQAGEWLRVKPLPPGLHLLTNFDVNDGHDPRLQYAWAWLSERGYRRADDCLAALRELCGQDGRDGAPAMCLRGKGKGTVSSSLIALRDSLVSGVYLHAQGPPDETPYEDCSSLLWQMAST
jgi:uncharacterized protein with NRDE domain